MTTKAVLIKRMEKIADNLIDVKSISSERFRANEKLTKEVKALRLDNKSLKSAVLDVRTSLEVALATKYPLSNMYDVPIADFPEDEGALFIKHIHKMVACFDCQPMDFSKF